MVRVRGVRVACGCLVVAVAIRSLLLARHHEAGAATRAFGVEASSRVHIVFSTDCSSFMRWQAAVLLDSAARVGQRGVVTQLVSGCSRSAREEIEASRATERYPFATHVHFTPDFNAAAVGGRFRFANKPLSMLHWLEHHGEAFRERHAYADEDVLVVSVDPDFVFLRPLDLWTLTASRRGDRWDDADTVRRRRGRPAASFYGLGAAWLRFHLASICGPDSPCLNVTADDVRRHYNAGPPYVAHWRDFREIARVWGRFTPKFWDDYPNIDGPNKDPTRHYAEMYAYVAAAAHLRMPHLLLRDVQVGCMVGWSGVDHLPRDAAQDHSCVEPRRTAAIAGPHLVHYCQRHAVGPFKFGKRAVPHDVLRLDPAALANRTRSPTPPPDLFLNASAYAAAAPCPARHRATCGAPHRDAFLICALHSAINGARRRAKLAPSLAPPAT